MEVEHLRTASGKCAGSDGRDGVEAEPIRTSLGKGVGVRVLEDDGGRARFVVGGAGVDSSLVNAWRRAMIGEVDILAIDQLDIHANGTMLHDELLFHRLGYIPVICPPAILDSMVKRTECNCDDGCSRCRLKFTFRQKNNSDEAVEALSDHLLCENQTCRVKPGIVIAKLHKMQELAFTAFAIKANSREENNAKWNPVTIASYRPVAKVTTNSALIQKHLTPEERKRICAAEPGQVLQFDPHTQQIVPHPDAGLRCTYAGEFIEELADSTRARSKEEEAWRVGGQDKLNHPFISMTPLKDQFLMPVVSAGALPPREIAKRALAALRKRLARMLLAF